MAVSVRNDVIFRNDGDDSQVRWGDSAYGHWETCDFNWDDYNARYYAYEGWYINDEGEEVYG